MWKDFGTYDLGKLVSLQNSVGLFSGSLGNQKFESNADNEVSRDFFVCFVLFFEARFLCIILAIGTHSVDQAGLKPRDPLPLPLQCWD